MRMGILMAWSMPPTMSFGASTWATLCRVRALDPVSRLGYSAGRYLNQQRALSFGWEVLLFYCWLAGDGLRKPDIELIAERLCGRSEFGWRCHSLAADVA